MKSTCIFTSEAKRLTTSFAVLNNQATIEPIIPGNAAANFSPSLPNNPANAFNLSFTQLLFLFGLLLLLLLFMALVEPELLILLLSK